MIQSLRLTTRNTVAIAEVGLPDPDAFVPLPSCSVPNLSWIRSRNAPVVGCYSAPSLRGLIRSFGFASLSFAQGIVLLIGFG